MLAGSAACQPPKPLYLHHRKAHTGASHPESKLLDPLQVIIILKIHDVLKYTVFVGLSLTLYQSEPALAQPADMARFEEHQRNAVRDYYRAESEGKRCPPGLAKKNNGCMPPGQAKKWQVGQPLASDIVYYDIPTEIATQLGAPPEGHRYVRVASDILLITQGVGNVIDAIIGVE